MNVIKNKNRKKKASQIFNLRFGKTKFSSVFFITMLISINLSGQKILYPDAYTEPLLLNPSYAGIRNCTKFRTNYLKTYNYNMYSISASTHLTKFNASLALLISNLNEANNILSNTAAELTYVYRLPTRKKYKIQLALSGKISQEHINTAEIIFGSMINPLTGTISSSTPYYITPDFPAQFQLTASGLYFSNTYRFGFSTAIPDLLSSGSDKPAINPILNFHFGKIIQNPISKFKIMPVFIWNYQAPAQLFYLGSRFSYENFNLNLYINFQQNINSLTPVFSIGFSKLNVRFSYTYTSISYLKTRLTTYGHSLSIGIKLRCKKKRKNNNTIYCSDF